jgi:hypothetical protein
VLRIREIHFATPRTGSTDFHYLYYNSNTHLIAPGNLQWWASGSKITVPEWAHNGRRNLRVCFTRNRPIAMSVKIVANTRAALSGTLSVTPTLDGSESYLKPASVRFTYPAHAAEYWVDITTEGALPDEVGRYTLRLRWRLSGRRFRFGGPQRTRHRLYGIYGAPLLPDYDSSSVADSGSRTTRDQGTLSGTMKRLDHLMQLIGGRDRRHPAATHDDLIDLYWNLHKGINDTPGAPPYFDAGHNQYMTHDGSSRGTYIPLADQWLAWVTNPTQWNDCSCIGHVQLAKTMLAAIGLFARRTWVFPHTTRLPDGSTVHLSDTDLYCLGTYDTSKTQTWAFTHHGHPYTASPKLIEPGGGWENFEACMLSPAGKFLTGGYNTRDNPPHFHANKGFNSAAELLRWWCRTTREGGRFRRFVCWAYHDEATDEWHYWDRHGTHYDRTNYQDIRDSGNDLPIP